MADVVAGRMMYWCVNVAEGAIAKASELALPLVETQK